MSLPQKDVDKSRIQKCVEYGMIINLIDGFCHHPTCSQKCTAPRKFK